jgi:hypothetical protein
MAVKLGFITGEQQRLWEFENSAGGILPSKDTRQRKKGECLHTEHHNLYSSFSILKITNSRRSST